MEAIADPVENDHGWQKVTYAKRQRKAKQSESSKLNGGPIPNGNSDSKAGLFASLERHFEDRRRRMLESQRATVDVAPSRSKKRSEFDDDSEGTDAEEGDAVENGKDAEAKKVKPKKPKKHKVTVAEAAAKIDPADLEAFLADISASYEGQQEIQLMRFADYFGRAFSAVGGAQFPWVKMFRETTVAKLTNIPLSHISDAVYKTSIDWINQRSPEALSSFVLQALDSILSDLASQQTGSKKGVKQVSSKSQVAVFLVLAMVLRRKPDILIAVLPMLRESSKYQGQDKLPVIVWMIAQVSEGDLAVGLYSWAHNLLPIVSGKSSNPQSRDLILQLVEGILSTPKAQPILVNGAVRKGERLMPPSALEIVMRTTFPVPSARVKATERFEAIYPTLKEVALAGLPGSKAMKQVALQIMRIALKAAGESIPELSKEAAGIFIWSLGQNVDCYKHWDKLYEDNLEASVAVLKKLSEEWNELSVKLHPLDPLRESLKIFLHENEKVMAGRPEAAHRDIVREADKYCKVLLGKLSRGHGCMKSMVFAVIALAVGVALFSPNMENWDMQKLSAIFS